MAILALTLGTGAIAVAASDDVIVHTFDEVTTAVAVSPSPARVGSRGVVYVAVGSRTYFTDVKRTLSSPQDWHQDVITQMTVAPNQENLVTYSENDGVVQQNPMWSTMVGPAIQVGKISGLAVLGDNNTLAAIKDDGKLHRFDLKLGKEFGQPIGGLNTFTAYSMTLSPQGKHLVIGETNGKIRVYQTANWKLKTFKMPGKMVSVAFLSDQRFVATDDRGWISIFSPGGSQYIKRFRLKTYAHCMDVIDAGKVVLGCADNTVKVYNIKTGRAVETFDIQAAVHSVAYEPTTGLLVAAGKQKWFHVWLRNYRK